jgi:hypothetical protein
LEWLHEVLNVSLIIGGQDENECVLPIYHGVAANFNAELASVMGIDMGE